MTASSFLTLRSATGEFSGALGDVGTLLPYVVTGLLAGLFTPLPVFGGFAVGYLLVAVIYRVPVSVQPMKALGAVAITGGLSAVETAWAGTLLGAVLFGLALLPQIVTWARMVPQSVVVGLQAGLGLTLGAMAFSIMSADWRLAVPALSILSLSYIWPRGPWALVVVAGAVLVGVLWPAEPTLIPLPRAHEPSFVNAVLLGALPQLPLTLINAVVLAAAVSRTSFGDAARRVSERRLAATSGALNLCLAPLGAFPMCHGAGGIAAHHRFGARSIGAPLLMAGFCALAAVSGPAVVEVLAGIPMPIIGALLAYAAADLAFSRRLVDARPDCRPVIAVAAFGTFFFGAAIGLGLGLVSEKIRVHIARRAAA